MRTSAAHPVFVHAMWRTGSTFIWQKYRQQDGIRAYYEPLHERLLYKWVEDTWNPQQAQARRHPPINEPYFKEYPRGPSGLVEHFSKPLSYERYWLEEDSYDPGLFRYINNLLLRAHEANQRPVLQFNRSLLRCSWLTKSFSPINILLVRRPYDVWSSFLSLVGPYYITAICLIIGQNREHPLLGELAERFRIPLIVCDSVKDELRKYTPVVQSMLGHMYSVFYQFYLLTVVEMLPYMHCVIDMNVVSENQKIRDFIEWKLSSLGVGISLSDCAIPSYMDLQARSVHAVEGEQQCALRRYFASRERPRHNIVLDDSPVMSSYWQQKLSDLL